MSALVSFLFLSFLLFLLETLLITDAVFVAGLVVEPLAETGAGLLPDDCICCCDRRRRSARNVQLL